MKLITKVAAALLLTSTYALAWPLTGTVQEVRQNANGDLSITIVRDTDAWAFSGKIIPADDPYKKEKLALLLTAKSTSQLVTAGIDAGVITELTLR